MEISAVSRAVNLRAGEATPSSDGKYHVRISLQSDAGYEYSYALMRPLDAIVFALATFGKALKGLLFKK